MNNCSVFGNVMSAEAPSANNRGESENNLSPLQKIAIGENQYPINTSQAFRSALRERFRLGGLDVNRSRLHDAGQPAVIYQGAPDPNRYIDDEIMGFLEAKKNGSKKSGDLQTNQILALNPFGYETLLHQSPQTVFQGKNGEADTKNSENSALLKEEHLFTSYQYPFQLFITENLKNNPNWIEAFLVSGICDPCPVGGNHARFSFPMYPESLVLCVSSRICRNFDQYGFQKDHSFPDLFEKISKNLINGNDFFLAGRIVKKIKENTDLHNSFQSAGVQMFDIAEQAATAAYKAICTKLGI